jgi:hypothetical protein
MPIRMLVMMHWYRVAFLEVFLRCDILAACRCRGEAAAVVTTLVLVVVVCLALVLLVVINMVRDSEAPVHSGDFLKVLIR